MRACVREYMCMFVYLTRSDGMHASEKRITASVPSGMSTGAKAMREASEQKSGVLTEPKLSTRWIARSVAVDTARDLPSGQPWARISDSWFRFWGRENEGGGGKGERGGEGGE